MNFIKYNPKLSTVATVLRNNSTLAEIEMWKLIKNFYPEIKFLRQKPLDNFIVDFYCAKKKLILEIDGDVHERQKEKDLERDNLFSQKYKIRTIRFRNEDVVNNKSFLKKILDEALH